MKLIVTSAIITIALALPLAAAAQIGGAATPMPGKPVASKTASGQFATTATSATVKHPKPIYARFVGTDIQGMAVIACSHDFTISSNSYQYKHSGIFRLPIKPAKADSCNVVLSGSGSGAIHIEIRSS